MPIPRCYADGTIFVPSGTLFPRLFRRSFPIMMREDPGTAAERRQFQHPVTGSGIFEAMSSSGCIVTRAVVTVIIDENNLFREGLRRILHTTVFRCTKAVAIIDDIESQSFNSARPMLFIVGMDENLSATAATVQRLKADNPTARATM